MTAQGFFQVVLYTVVLGAAAWPLGKFMTAVYEGRPTWLTPVLGGLERAVYRIAGVDERSESDWRRYALAVLLFNVIGFAVVYVLQRLQGVLPLNPQGFGAVSPDSSFNTAVSFATNTNWQGYGGEATMSYLTQMLGLAVQNFVSAATGMAVLVALLRGFVRRETDRIGNFYVDLTRSTLYILLPLSLALAVVLMSQGVVQSFGDYRTVTLLDPVTLDDGQVVVEQTVPLGPAAPLEYRVLECLARHSGRIVRTQQLLRESWGPDKAGDTRALRVCIKNLRDKLEPNPRRPAFITTEVGLGYRLSAP
jgi:K+-transporting ATPase ATPase A chain